MRVLEQVSSIRGTPKAVVVDNGPEFAGKALDAWAYENGVGLHFIAPGKPVQNAYIDPSPAGQREIQGRVSERALV